MIVRGKADFTTPEWIESFKRAKDFIKTYVDPAFSGIDYPTGAGLFATGKYAMWPEGSFSGGDIMAAKPTFQKLGAFNAAFGDDKDANAVQPVYGDLGWAGLRYTKNAGMVMDWINFFGQKENFTSFMQVLQYYPTMTDVKLTGPVPEAEAPLLKKTAVSQNRLTLPGMTFDTNWGELLLSDQYTPETFAEYVPEELGRLAAPVAEVHRHVRRRLGQAVLQLIALTVARPGRAVLREHGPVRGTVVSRHPRQEHPWDEPRASGHTSAWHRP